MPMSDFQTRLAAANRGEKVYDGRPCKHGHGTRRYTSNGVCTECIARSAAKRQAQVRDALKGAK